MKYDYSLRARDQPRKPKKKPPFKMHTSTTSTLFKSIRPPSRLDTQPYYKNAKRPPEQQGRSFKEPRRKRTDFFQHAISLSTTCFNNKYKAKRLGSSGLSQSDSSLQGVKTYKLSDFGLCVNVNERRPAQFGCSRYLAPEVLRLGPDHPQVSVISWTSGSWTCTRWA